MSLTTLIHAQGQISVGRSHLIPILPVYRLLDPCDDTGPRDRALGANYSAELWLAVGANAQETSLSRTEAVPVVNLQPDGRFWIGSGYTVNGIVALERVTLQVRVWENRGGEIASWLEASQRNDVAFGKSSLIRNYYLGGVTSDGTGYLALSIFDFLGPITISTVCPEPSSYLLLALGAGCGLLMRRRSAGGTTRARAQY